MGDTKLLILDKTDIFECQIAPLLRDLTSLLRHNKMPFFIAVAKASDGQKTCYHFDSNDIRIPGQKMAENMIPSFINVVNGFMTIPPGSIVEMDL